MATAKQFLSDAAPQQHGVESMVTIPAKEILALKLSAVEKVLLMVIAEENAKPAEEQDYSPRHLGERCGGCAQRTIQEYIKKLESAGFINRASTGGGRGRFNHYTVNCQRLTAESVRTENYAESARFRSDKVCKIRTVSKQRRICIVSPENTEPITISPETMQNLHSLSDAKTAQNLHGLEPVEAEKPRKICTVSNPAPLVPKISEDQESLNINNIHGPFERGMQGENFNVGLKPDRDILENPVNSKTTAEAEEPKKKTAAKARSTKKDFYNADYHTTIQNLFARWQKTHGYKNAILKTDSRRYKNVLDRLQDGYAVRTLELAIYGCKFSPHHMGKNETSMKYNDLELICRDTEHVDKFAALGEENLPKDKSTVPQKCATLSKVEQWEREKKERLAKGETLTADPRQGASK